MDNKTQLPNGFITLEEAISLINSDTRKDAKVDTQYLVSHLNWIEEQHNFRIPLLRNATEEEIKEQMNDPMRRGRVKSTVSVGSKYVFIERAYHAEALKEAIRNHYKEMVGRDFEEKTVRSISSVADEEKTGGNVTPREDKPIAKEGAIIGSGEHITTNGATM